MILVILTPLLERVRAGVEAVAKTACAGTLRVDDELHLVPLTICVYSHVRDRWRIFHAQPIVLNKRQAGAAIEPV